MRKILIGTLLSGIMLFAGCNKFLDKMPDNRTIIDSEPKVRDLLTSAYADRGYADLINARCDGFVDFGSDMRGASVDPFFINVQTAFGWEPYTLQETGNCTYEQFWTSCYSAIATANHALEAIETLPQTPSLPIYKAEARLTRAFHHLCLLSLFSNMFDYANQATNPGIPYVDEPEIVIIKKYDRGTVASTLEKIREDIVESVSDAGALGDFGQPAFHFYDRPAKALAIRFSMFTHDYNTAISYANQLMPVPSKFINVTGTRAGTNTFDGSTRKYVDPSDAAYLFFKANLADWNVLTNTISDPYETGKQFSKPTNPWNLLSSEVASVLTYSWGTSYVGQAYDGTYFTRIAGGAGSPANVTGTTWRYRRWSWSLDRTGVAWTPKHYNDFKVSGSSGSGVPYTKFNIFRMEEALLNRAEAYAMTGKYNDAIYDLQMFAQGRMTSYNPNNNALDQDRIVAYYGSQADDPNHFINNQWNKDRFSGTDAEKKLQKSLILCILDYRLSEFTWEGLRYFDILRWNIPVTHQKSNGLKSTLTPDDDRRVLQIPQSAAISGVQPNKMDNTNPWE